MEAKSDHVEVGRSSKSHLGRGSEVVRGGIKLGVDHIARDVKRWAGDLGRGWQPGCCDEGRYERAKCGSSCDAQSVKLGIFQDSLHSITHCLAALHWLTLFLPDLFIP
jgi:hypothetical protein